MAAGSAAGPAAGRRIVNREASLRRALITTMPRTTVPAFPLVQTLSESLPPDHRHRSESAGLLRLSGPRSKPVGAAARCAAGVLALLLSGCGAEKENGTDAANGSRAPDDMEAARSYVAQFTRENPDVCFDEVALERPSLAPREGGSPGAQVQPTRVVVAIDGSGSMAGQVDGRTKLDLAREAALSFVDGLPETVETSILVFGQQGDNSESGKARSCAAVDVLVPLTRDRARLRAAVGEVRAVGWTPLAGGLTRAQSMLSRASAPGEQVIYVVSDGEETCGGNPVAVAERINRESTRAIVNIIGFGLPSNEARALQAVADAGGGRFVNVANRGEYDRTLASIREANRAAGNAIRAGVAGSANTIRTSGAVSRAAICTSNLISGESNRMSRDLSARSIRGEPAPFAEAAQALLEQRHDSIRAREQAFRSRLERNEGAAQSAIDSAAAAVQ